MADDDICSLCGADVLDIDQKCPGCGADLASTAARRLIGTFLLSDYEVLEVLGQGGMAVVYRGRHRVTGQEVALKVLPPELATRKEIQSRFVEEARALAQLDHPNIVHLYNFDADGGAFVLAMQLADGPTWERLILEGGLDWRRSIEIALQVCSALEYAHNHGIVHRDMKPSNVLVRESDGKAMVMDFGIAKGASDSRLTATGQTMGTVRYMSPEQVRGKQVDKRSDIYSLAVTLYESLAGQTPFTGETHFEIMSQHLQSVASPLAERMPEIPESLSRAVAWAMKKKPDDRPASVAAFSSVLSQILAGTTPMIPDAHAVSTPAVANAREARSGRSTLAIAIVVTLLLAGGVAVLLTMRANKDKAAAAGADAAAVTTTPEERALEMPDLPSGVVIGSDQQFANNLRLMIADGISPEPYLDAYQAGVERWRQFLARRGLQSKPELRRPMPEARLIVAPADLLCDPGQFKSDSELKECLAVGTYQPAAHALLIPDNVEPLARAIDSFISVVYCEPSPTATCTEAATAFQQEIFSN